MGEQSRPFLNAKLIITDQILLQNLIEELKKNVHFQLQCQAVTTFWIIQKNYNFETLHLRGVTPFKQLPTIDHSLQGSEIWGGGVLMIGLSIKKTIELQSVIFLQI